MFAQVGLNNMVNLQFFAKRPDCTVFYCLSLDLWLTILIGSFVVIINGLVAFGIWFCRKRGMCKGKKQVQTQYSKKGKEENCDYKGYCYYSGIPTQGWCAKPKVTYDGSFYV